MRRACIEDEFHTLTGFKVKRVRPDSEIRRCLQEKVCRRRTRAQGTGGSEMGIATGILRVSLVSKNFGLGDGSDDLPISFYDL